MAVGHFHSLNDGIDDLAVVSPSDKTVTVLIADGKGGFKTATAQTFGTTLASLSVGDLNQDTIDDIAVADQAGTVWILLGNLDGTFQAPYPLPAIKVCQSGSDKGVPCVTNVTCSGTPKPLCAAAAPKGLVIAEFDSANGNDLAVTDYKGSQVLLLLNNGDDPPTFTLPPDGHFPTPAQPGSIVAADFDDDGRLDLAVLSQQGTTARKVAVLHGSLDGGTPSFSTSPNFVVGMQSTQLSLADFDNNGLLDIAAVNVSRANNGADVTFLLGQDDGFFITSSLAVCPLSPSPFLPSCSARTLVAADFDSNGTTDLAIGVAGGDPVTGADVLETFSGGTNGAFLRVQSLKLSGSGPSALAVGKFTDSGLLDVAVATSSNNAVQLFVNATRLIEVGSAIAQWGTQAPINVSLKDASRQVASLQNDIKFDGSMGVAEKLACTSGATTPCRTNQECIGVSGDLLDQCSVSMACTSGYTTPCVTDQECIGVSNNPLDQCSVSVPDCSVNPNINKPGSSFSWLPTGCVGVNCQSVRALIGNFGPGSSQSLIPNGVLYACDVRVLDTAAPGGHPLTISGTGASDNIGKPLDATGTDGNVTVTCVGDCNLNTQVTVDEIITGVSIFFNPTLLPSCPAFDADGSGTVTVDEVLAAVNAALNGCAPPPTPTPTSTATATSTVTPTGTPTPTSTPSATASATATPTATPPATTTPTSTDTPTTTPTATPTNTPTSTPTDTPTSTPTDTPTSTPTDTPTSTPTDTPTSTPTDTPTSTPTNTP